MASTLNTDMLVQDVVESFKKQWPMIQNFSTNFTDKQAKKDQVIKSRINALPTVQDYNASTGYQLGTNDIKALGTDVDVTLSRHKHVPVKIDHLDAISTNRDLYSEAIQNVGYVLGKSIIDYALTLVTNANFSSKTTEATADIDADTLGAVRKAMNNNGALNFGRVGVIDSDAWQQLTEDTRIASRDFHGQMHGAEGYGHFQNIAGFQHLYEYPDVPSNSENLTGFFFDPRAIVLATAVPSDSGDLARRYGIPQTMGQENITDPDSGMTFSLFRWQEPGTADLYISLSVIYGVTAGGSALGNAGHRIVSA